MPFPLHVEQDVGNGLSGLLCFFRRLCVEKVGKDAN